MNGRWDVVIVGAGSAGCVLAAELSRDPARRVLVLEAGPSHAEGPLPDDIASLTVPYRPHHLWGDDDISSGGQLLPFPRGRVVGGSSAINNTMAFRPSPRDVDGWGLAGWRWSDLLPHLVAIEHDLDFAAPWHGDSGPLPIVRPGDDELTELQIWFGGRCRELGFPAEADHNDPTTNGGVGPIPMNRRGTRRVSAADAWLYPALGRPNLELRSQVEVQRVEIRSGRAVGVVAGGELVPAEEVVVCSGVIGSPVLLERSGVAHPELGHNLSDHPSVPVRLETDPVEPAPSVPSTQMVLRTADLRTMVFPMASGFLFASPQSVASRGRVSTRADGSVAVDWPFLDDPACRQDLRAALRLAWSIAGERRRGGALDLDDDAAVDAYVDRRHRPFLHGAGTCAMGRVVDTELRVEGTAGLRVCDASILPTVPRANPNITILAVAHRAAQLMASG